jgi:hypothetical protein
MNWVLECGLIRFLVTRGNRHARLDGSVFVGYLRSLTLSVRVMVALRVWNISARSVDRRAAGFLTAV